jgi:hypothetical protein
LRRRFLSDNSERSVSAGWFTANEQENEDLVAIRKDLALIKEKMGIGKDG